LRVTGRSATLALACPATLALACPATLALACPASHPAVAFTLILFLSGLCPELVRDILTDLADVF